jgi:hypothetical protein
MSEAEFTELVRTSQTYADALRRLGLRPAGGNALTLKERVQKLNLDVSHFVEGARAVRSGPHLFNPAAPLAQVMVEKSTYSRWALKKRLLREGILHNTCSKCGQGAVWQGEPLALILDHINGVPDDHRRENLRLLCPNCNSQQATFAGKRNAKARNTCASCAKPISREATHCKSCVSKDHSRKVKDRPSREVLCEQVAALGYLGTGRLYGVSDNAIRKWLK